MANPWFRLYSEIIDDEKLLMLAFQDRWHYVAILCLKNKGVLDSEVDASKLNRKVAVKLGLSLSEADELKRRLVEEDLITEDWQPSGWDSRQFQSDSSKERVRKYRERKKKQAGNSECNVTVTAQEEETEEETDTDIQDNASALPRCPYQELVNLYHEILPNMQRVRILTDARKAHLRARWRENPDLDWWRNRLFVQIKNSDFLMGRVNPGPGRDRPFECNLDWILKPSNFVNIREGKYQNRKARA